MSDRQVSFLQRGARKARMLLHYVLAIIAALKLRKTKGNCIALYGFYGASNKAPKRNIGDSAILLSMLQSMENIGCPKLIVVMCKEGVYSSFGEEYQIKPPRWREYDQWLEIVSQTGVFVMGGGGLLQDYTGGGGTTLFLFMINLLFWLAGRKIIWYSVGIGPLASFKSRIFTSLAARITNVITVRDSQSKDLLVSLGISDDRVFATSDLAFGLEGLRASNANRQNTEPESIGLSVIPFYEVSGIDRQKDIHTVSEYRDFIRYLLDRGFSISLLVFDNTQDKKICDEILKDTSIKGVKLVGIGASVTEMLEQYADFDYVIGMRFHSVVFGCVTGVPTGAVIYHPKVRSLVENFELQKYACELEELTSNKLKEILIALETDRESLQERVVHLVEAERHVLCRNVEFLKQLLEENP